MARKELGPATLAIVQAIEAVARRPMLVACSGGADSLALAAGAAVVSRRRKLACRAVVVDHGLQDGSAEVADQVAGRLAGLGVAAAIHRAEVSRVDAGPEAAAREARYRALEEAATSGEDILLGHTLEDQAETVLLGLVRGSGTRSLAGMSERRGPYLRPLLRTPRERTRQACRELGLDWWEDPHNVDPRYTRVRVRERVLPVLEGELGPGIAAALARTAELARDDADLLDELANAAWADSSDAAGLDCAAVAALPPALRGRVLRSWLQGVGAREVTSAHLDAAVALVTDWRGQRRVELPGVAVERRHGRLRPAGGCR